MTTSEPPYVVYVDRNLGLSVAVLKNLFKFCLLEYQIITARLHNKDVVLCAVNVEIDTMSKVLLIIKGDLPSAFQYRKLLIESGHTSIHSEMSFTAALFTKHPKSPSGWYHRRWCLQVHMKRLERSRLSVAEVETERELCRRMAERNPKNYYAWTHRLWLLDHMSELQVSWHMHCCYSSQRSVTRCPLSTSLTAGRRALLYQ